MSFNHEAAWSSLHFIISSSLKSSRSLISLFSPVGKIQRRYSTFLQTTVTFIHVRYGSEREVFLYVSVPGGFDPSAGFQAGDIRSNMFYFFSRAWRVMTETWTPRVSVLCFWSFSWTKTAFKPLTDSVSTSVNMKPLDIFNETCLSPNPTGPWAQT